MLLFVSIIGTMFTNCSSEDVNDDSSNNNESIIGYWIRYTDNDQYLEEFAFFDDGTCSFTESYIPDNDFEETSIDYGKGTYVLKGNKLTMMLNFNDEKEIWTITVKSLKAKKELVLVDEDGETYIYDYYLTTK